MIKPFYLDRHYPGIRKLNKKLISRFIGELKLDDWQAVEATIFDVFKNDYYPSFSQIHRPTLVISEDQDQAVPYQWSQELAQMISGSEFTLLKNENHLVPFFNPDKVTGVIREFLDHE